MSNRLVFACVAVAAVSLIAAACQPAPEGKSDASTEGAMAPASPMAPASGGMAPAAAPADKMAPASQSSMAPADDKMATPH
jgi:hypothetical protein